MNYLTIVGILFLFWIVPIFISFLLYWYAFYPKLCKGDTVLNLMELIDENIPSGFLYIPVFNWAFGVASSSGAAIKRLLNGIRVK